MRYAVITGGVVANVVISTDEVFAAAQGWIAAPDEVAAGWTYAGGSFSPPPPAPDPVPASVTRKQAKLALLNAGLLDAVENALNDLSSPQKEAALIEWADAGEFRRDHPLIADIAAALELTGQQVNDLFRAAAALP